MFLFGSMHGREARRLDYERIAELGSRGFGYKKIAKITGYARSSIGL